MALIRLSVGTEVGWFIEEIEASRKQIEDCMALPKEVCRVEYWRRVSGKPRLLEDVNPRALVWEVTEDDGR